MDKSIKKNDEFIVTIDRLGDNGEGIAVYEGVVIFIPFALPGEEVLVHIINDKHSFMVGKIVKILKPSKDRIDILTLCCDGFVFNSPEVGKYGNKVQCVFIALPNPTSALNWRIDSINGKLSISPIVPPISIIWKSGLNDFWAAINLDLISLVIWGITWTVPPK